MGSVLNDSTRIVPRIWESSYITTPLYNPSGLITLSESDFELQRQNGPPQVQPVQEQQVQI